MADRFVLVPVRKWRDPWYRRLSPSMRDAWDYFTQYPEDTYTGLFERDFADMAHDAMLSKRDLQNAIDLFISEGKLLVQGDCYLPVKYFDVQMRGERLHPNDNRVKPILRELGTFEKKAPQLVYEWLKRYMPSMVGKPLDSPLVAPPKQIKEQEEEQDQEATSTQASTTAGKVRPEVVVAAPLPRLSELEKKLPGVCQQAWDAFKRRVARQNGGEVSMDRLVEILQHILDEAERFKLDGELLLQGLAAANRNGSIRADYVVKAAIGIREDAKAEEAAVPASQTATRPKVQSMRPEAKSA